MHASVVVAACGASAGAHAALVPEHLRERPALGAAFAVAALLLAAVAVTLALRPRNRRFARLAVLLLTGLIAAWAASRLAGIPVLQPHPEPVDRAGVATKLVEALGLASALWLTHPTGGRAPSANQEVPR